MSVENIRNYELVSPEIATAGQPTECQLTEVAQQGFVIVINLGLLDPRYCLEDEESLVRNIGMVYHHIPVEFQAPKLEDLRRFFATMDASHGRKAFIHCAANKRVSCFVALYGQKMWGWSSDTANAFVRRIWEPDQVWSAFIEQARKESI